MKMTSPFLSFEEAVQFLLDRTINPKTGRKIEHGKNVYNKIMKDIEDNYFFLLNSKSSKTSYSGTIKNIPPNFISKEFYVET